MNSFTSFNILSTDENNSKHQISFEIGISFDSSILKRMKNSNRLPTTLRFFYMEMVTLFTTRHPNNNNNNKN